MDMKLSVANENRAILAKRMSCNSNGQGLRDRESQRVIRDLKNIPNGIRYLVEGCFLFGKRL